MSGTQKLILIVYKPPQVKSGCRTHKCCRIPLTGDTSSTESETEGRRVVARGWGKGKWGVILWWVSVWEEEKILEVVGGNGCTTVWVPLMPPNCTLKSGEEGEFYFMYIFTHTHPDTQVKFQPVHIYRVKSLCCPAFLSLVPILLHLRGHFHTNSIHLKVTYVYIMCTCLFVSRNVDI